MISSIKKSFYKEGDEFTSINQHLRLESIIISYPNNSKQLGLWGMYFIHDISDFNITSCICAYIYD